MADRSDKLKAILAKRKASLATQATQAVPKVPATDKAKLTTPVAAPTTTSVATAQSTYKPSGSQISLKLAELEQAILNQLPDMPYILKRIHTDLRDDPETVTAMTDEEIGIIVAGVCAHTNTTIVPAPKKSSKKRTQPLSLDLLD